MPPAPMKRFWTAATAAPEGDGFGVRLDGRPLRTPARKALAVPTLALAQAIAGEWQAAADPVDPLGLPLTRLANSAIDGVAASLAGVRDAVAAYGASDLLCYRAPQPEGLVRRQAERWDPWLAWARDHLGAPLVAAVGVMHVAQPPGALARLTDEVARHDAFTLAALHQFVAISGSLILGLAVVRGALDPGEAFDLGRIDEAWQAAQWGEDAEAAAVTRQRRADFLAAHRFLALLQG
jgi:chaperone required for assembly of F1-ATPase